MKEIINFPEQDNTNLEEVCQKAINDCNIIKPKKKICQDCGKEIKIGEKYSRWVKLERNSTEKYVCKSCNVFDELVCTFLQKYISYFNEGEFLGVPCWQLGYIKNILKKHLNKKPKSWINRKEFKSIKGNKK